MTLDETIDKDSAAAASPDIARRHTGHAHRHAHGAEALVSAQPKPARRRTPLGERLFLGSALERVALALIVVGVLWLAVVWAMG